MTSSNLEIEPIPLEQWFPLLGEFVFRYARVQSTLRSVLVGLLGIPPTAAALMVHGMGDSAFLRKLKIALTEYGRGYEALIRSVEYVEDVQEFRDALLHWTPMTNEQAQEFVAMAQSHRDLRQPLNPKIRLTLAQFRRINDWLFAMEWDCLTAMVGIVYDEPFRTISYRTLVLRQGPPVPQAVYATPHKPPKKEPRKRRKKS